MSLNRSLRSNTSLTGRVSPNPSTAKLDQLNNSRSASPPPLALNSRSSSTRLQDDGRSLAPTKPLNEDDMKFYRAAFERCAAPPDRRMIVNRDKFHQALNYVSYDLTRAKIDQLWSNYEHEITFAIFQRILQEEKPIDERSLEEAFDTLYNKDRKFNSSVIDYDRFRADLIEKGDRFTEDEFQAIRSLLGTNEGKIDVKKLTRKIGDNKNDCRQRILTDKRQQERDEVARPPSRVNSPKPNRDNKTDGKVQIVIDPTSKKLSIPPKIKSIQMKGVFFCEYFETPSAPLYYSVGYSFEIKKNTPIWITLEPAVSRYHKDMSLKQLDVRLLLFQITARSTQRRLVHISSERSGIKSYLQLDELERGSYEIVPITSGAVLRPRTREVNERSPIKKLREIKRGGQGSMTRDYRDALEYVFELFDFDENKQLDRNEYNLWTKRTTGEEISDDDWSMIRENLKLDVDESISKKKFLELNEFEVKGEETTEEDLWSGLRAVGFNYALELDMMCPFNLTIHANDLDLHLTPTSYVELSEVKKVLLKFLQTKAERIKLSNPLVQCWNYSDDCGSILFVQNTDSAIFELSVQVTNTKNAALSIPIDARKPPVIRVDRNAYQVLWFAHKLDNQRGMELDAIVQIQ